VPPAVAVVGSLNLDMVVDVARLPGRGETVVGRNFQSSPGGKGANQAAAAAALSSGIAMAGRVGDDTAGAALVADLRTRGVDTSGVLSTPGVPTGAATVAVEPGGENLIIVAPGANAAVTPQDVAIAAVRSAQVVLLQLEIPLAAVAATVAVATGTIVLNPAPATELPADLLAGVDVLVPNEWELAALAGVRPATYSPQELATLARKVTAGPVVVTMGARGALVVGSASDDPMMATPPAVTPVDTTGAGDCFCGALCVSLASGARLADAARYAVAAAALSTTGAGARGALPDDAAVRTLLESSS
jgi:ribokinase